MEYLYHIVIPKEKSAKINDCFAKMCKTRASPFLCELAAKGFYGITHVAAFSLIESELDVFNIICELNDPGVFWWKVEKETGKLDECNDADCMLYVGEKLDPKQLFRKAGFIIIPSQNG